MSEQLTAIINCVEKLHDPLTSEQAAVVVAALKEAQKERDVARRETRDLAENGYKAAVWGWNKNREETVAQLIEAKQAINRCLDDLERGYWPSIAATAYLFRAVNRKPGGIPPDVENPFLLVEQGAWKAQDNAARGDCRINGGWMDEVECQIDGDPACHYHLWQTAQQAQARLEAKSSCLSTDGWLAEDLECTRDGTVPSCSRHYIEAKDRAQARMKAALVEPINDSQGHPTLRGCKDCHNLWRKGGPEKHLEGCVLSDTSWPDTGWPDVVVRVLEALKAMLKAAPQSIDNTQGHELYKANELARTLIEELSEYGEKIARFPDDVIAWRTERDYLSLVVDELNDVIGQKNRRVARAKMLDVLDKEAVQQEVVRLHEVIKSLEDHARVLAGVRHERNALNDEVLSLKRVVTDSEAENQALRAEVESLRSKLDFAQLSLKVLLDAN